MKSMMQVIVTLGGEKPDDRLRVAKMPTTAVGNLYVGSRRCINAPGAKLCACISQMMHAVGR